MKPESKITACAFIPKPHGYIRRKCANADDMSAKCYNHTRNQICTGPASPNTQRKSRMAKTRNAS